MGTLERRTTRCAIYTRKSSEEGLEQAFNSLDAQREACQAYILSQRQEGWKATGARYDDGGFSGGSIERPGLKLLLADIEAKKIDTVVVYKVDRLTRSLADFAKIIEVFDARGVSFVSVTQQFNTTSSMGRLTLNVLLSFAQFEREVTGERICDKIAASKRKGMWMGGVVPLGYHVKDHRLILNEQEAERVREIFRLYLDLKCVKKLKVDLDRREVKSKIRMSRSGLRSGGRPYSRGALYKILQNRIYLGEIPHKDESYPGAHTPAIDRELWDRVRALMSENVHARRHRKNASARSLFCGLMYGEDGSRFTPSHAIKRGKRYRYYVSQKALSEAESDERIRIPAHEIENLVLTELKSFFASGDRVVSALGLPHDELETTRVLLEAALKISEEFNAGLPETLSELIDGLVSRIVVRQDSIEVQLPRDRIRARLPEPDATPSPEPERVASPDQDQITLSIPAKLKRCSDQMRLIIPSQSGNSEGGRTVPALIKAIGRAQDWVQKIVAGEYRDQRAVAVANGFNERYVSRLLPLAFLAPDIVETILNGRQAPEMTLGALLDKFPLSWAEQKTKIAIE